MALVCVRELRSSDSSAAAPPGVARWFGEWNLGNHPAVLMVQSEFGTTKMSRAQAEPAKTMNASQSERPWLSRGAPLGPARW